MADTLAYSRPREQNSYDVFAYPQFACTESHPDRMAVLARLHGLTPAPVDRCRVLEIGCNSGGNLLPMAYALPESDFVGFDLARVPIERAQEQAKAVGLRNVKLYQADILTAGDDLGEFDYIIAHGVYAWVPQEVRNGLLRLCARHLTPHGIAYISYDALPGAQTRMLVHEVVLPLLAQTEDPLERVGAAFEAVQFFAASLPEDSPLRTQLEREAEELLKRDPHVSFHDVLSGAYRPVSFANFARHAAEHGLRYMCESRLAPPRDPEYREEMQTKARELAHGDPLAREQVFDMLRGRSYRESLLCHDGAPVESEVQWVRLRDLRLASSAAGRPAGGELRTYTLPSGIRIDTDDPRSMAIIEHLMRAWPCSIAFADLEDLLREDGVPVDDGLLQLMMKLVIARFVDVRTWDPPVGPHVPSRPQASAWARLEAAFQDKTTTLLHTTLGMSDLNVRRLLTLLDGSRDRNDLLQALRKEHRDVPEAELRRNIEHSLRLLNAAGAVLGEGLVE